MLVAVWRHDREGDRRSCHVHKTKVSRAVALLEGRKLVTRRTNRADLREAFLSLTSAGREIYSELAPIALDFAHQLLETVDFGRPSTTRSRAQKSYRAIGAACAPYRQRTPSRLDCSGASRGQSVKLYSYFRSSAAYRVRIALNLKGLQYETVPIHLTKDGGRQHTPEFRAINPQARVPALELSNGEVLTQSLAIIEYLDDIHPEPPLLPADALGRAKSRAIAQMIACDIHPLNNLIALQYLRRQLKHEQPEIDAWYHHWIIEGFTALEGLLGSWTLRLRGPRHARRHLPGATGRKCATPQGAARQIPKNRRDRRGLPEASGFRQSKAGKPAGCRMTATWSSARPPSRIATFLHRQRTARDRQQNCTRRPLDGRRIAFVFGHGGVDPRAIARRIEHF